MDEFGRAVSKKQSVLATHRQSVLLKELPEREVGHFPVLNRNNADLPSNDTLTKFF